MRLKNDLMCDRYVSWVGKKSFEDRQKSFQNAMAGFLPDNDSSEKCKNLVIKQSELADRLGVTVTPAMVVLEPSVHTFLGSVSPDKISELQ
jgi:thiol:disulfide interchange protein DsbC